MIRRKKKTKQQVQQQNRARSLWLLYRITPEERDRIEAYQRNHPKLKHLLAAPGKRNCVDHFHLSGEIRGILEWRINKGLGLLEKACPDNFVEVLEALAIYYRRFPARLALGGKRYGLLGLAKRKKVMVYGPPK